jgi:hypothetical protein
MSLPPPVDIQQQLTAANTAWKKLRRLAAYASFDGWTLTLLGALTMICGGYGSPLGLLISFVLLGGGLFELDSVKRLGRLNPKAIVRLACNQLGLAVGLTIYAVVNLIQARHGGGVAGQLQQSIAEAQLADAGQISSRAVEIFYSGLIGITIVVQGGTALFYLTRQNHLQRYLRETPDWIQQMQRESGHISL